MAAPTFTAAGAASFTATNNAALTPGLPSGWAADDIHVLLVHTSSNTDIPEPAGWTKFSPSAATENNTGAQRVELWWRRAVAGDAAPSVAAIASSAVRGAQIFGIRGCPTSGDPFAGATRSNNAASATVATASMTPSVDESFNLFVYAYEDNPSSASQPTDWSAFTVATSTLGTDMAIGFATRTLSTATALDPTTTVSGGSFANSVNVGVLLSFQGIVAIIGTATVGDGQAHGGTHTGTVGVGATGNATVGAGQAHGGAHTADVGGRRLRLFWTEVETPNAAAIFIATVGGSQAHGGAHSLPAPAVGEATVGAAQAHGGTHIGTPASRRLRLLWAEIETPDAATVSGTATVGGGTAQGGTHAATAGATGSAMVGDANAGGGVHAADAGGVPPEVGTAGAGDAGAHGGVHTLTLYVSADGTVGTSQAHGGAATATAGASATATRGQAAAHGGVATGLDGSVADAAFAGGRVILVVVGGRTPAVLVGGKTP